jgi:hypothetical protein
MSNNEINTSLKTNNKEPRCQVGVKIQGAKKIARRLVSLTITGYQLYVSPYLGADKCRFYPSCSEYAKNVVEIHGIVKGSILAIWRILRCNPFSSGGIDEAPAKFTFHRETNSRC